ncbi:MAG: nitroreductase family protein, partial [Candidatus Bathyarchaeota archaeon]|nr:nitroreductase family protein [Candidatus Bathyarchaeota archaeon]
MNDELINAILARRSIRKYTAEPVSDEKIIKLLEATMAAPSASNRRPWHFVVVTERGKLDELAEGHPYGKMLFETPPLHRRVRRPGHFKSLLGAGLLRGHREPAPGCRWTWVG